MNDGLVGQTEIPCDDPQDMGNLTFQYVEGLQWVIRYYYGQVVGLVL
jgi:5'-3' exonuclease